MPSSSSSASKESEDPTHPSSNSSSSSQGVSPPHEGNGDAMRAAAVAAASAIDFLTVARGLKTTPRTGWVLQEAGPKIESVADHSWRLALMTLLVSSSSSSTSSPTSTTTSTTTHVSTTTSDTGDGSPRTTTTTTTTTTTEKTTTSTTTTTMDTIKCLKMALIHDLAEARVGDITPHCGISNETKHELEYAAMIQLTMSLRTSPPQVESSSATTPTTPSSSTGTGTGTPVGDEILALWKEYEEGTTVEAKVVKDMDKLEMILQALEYEQDGKYGKSLDGFFDSTRDQWRTEVGRAWGQEIESRRPRPATTTGTQDDSQPY